MKKQTFLKMTAVIAFFFFAQTQFVAQGNFNFSNNTANVLTVEVWADYDDCAGAYLCSSGPVVIPAFGSFVFNTCTSNGAWKYMKVADSCGGVVVGYCGFVTTDTFTDCNANTVTVNWTDEHTGDAN